MGGRRGTTLPELIISMSITALVASGMASILYAASYGTSSRREIRRLVVRSQQVRSRIDNSIRSARCILAAGSSSGSVYLVLWKGDTNKDSKVNISELQMIKLASGSTALISYEAASIPATDTAYANTSNFYTVAENLRTAGTLAGTTWSQNASSASFTLNNATALQATLVTWKVTLTTDLVSESLVGAAAIRRQVAPQ